MSWGLGRTGEQLLKGWPAAPPEGPGLGDCVPKEHHIRFEYAATLRAGREVEVLASTLELNITIWSPDWDVDLAIWLHDHVALLQGLIWL